VTPIAHTTLSGVPRTVYQSKVHTVLLRQFDRAFPLIDADTRRLYKRPFKLDDVFAQRVMRKVLLTDPDD